MENTENNLDNINNNINNSDQSSKQSNIHPKRKKKLIILLIAALIVCIPLIVVFIRIKYEQHLDKLFNPYGCTDIFAYLNIDLPSPEGVTFKRIATDTTYRCPKDIKSGIYYIKIDKKVANRNQGNAYSFYYWEKKQDYEHQKMLFEDLSNQDGSYLKIRIKRGDFIEFEVDENTNLKLYIEDK